MSDIAIIAPKLPPERFAVTQEIVQRREQVLEKSAMIAVVKNAEQNDKCAAARRDIKALLNLLESQRKKAKEPIIELGRQLDTLVAAEKADLEKEEGRLANLEKEFVLAEQRRIREEQEAQQREIERIERERQAELARIERERQENERKAREAAAAAARLAAEATNKAQREAAEKARLESERLAKEAADRAQQQAESIQAQADTLVAAESAPIERTKATGQVVTEEWVIEQISDFQLMKSRPDLVRKIEWDMVGIKQALSAGQTLPGVKARKDIKVGMRAGRAPVPIEV